MLNIDFIKRKISLIQDEVVKLSDLAKYTLDEIANDFIKQAAVERVLERIIARAIDINQHIIAESENKNISAPKDYKETFTSLAELGIYDKSFAEEISKSVGTRNILVHEYDKIDYSRVYNSIGDCLRDYNKYCDYILKFLEK
ncbi:MAG: DUF86 domain-containing protein [Candidatus Pacebacteria bacterium]|nr:DUF86 domain-containing protein [Candidatus Paceibacterota bacterium]NUQ57552.1 DUF86 domain-containing protein [Candidatus Paceibacter sp.]